MVATAIRSGLAGMAMLAALTTAVACGNSDDTGDNGGGSGGSCTAPTDECTLLTISEAATALGSETATSTPGMMAPGDPSVNVPASGVCSYGGVNEASSGGDSIAVGYSCGLEASFISAEPQAVKTIIATGLGVAVPSLGDLAVWESSGSFGNGTDGGLIGGGTLTVYFDNAEVTVILIADGTDADIEARAVAAAKLVISRL